jgi:hypothetical protein
MLYNVTEVYVHSTRDGPYTYFGIQNDCWIDVPYPVTAVVMGFENILKAFKLNKPSFNEPNKYKTFVLVQDEKMKKKWVFSVKRRKKNYYYLTHIEQIIFYQSKI